MSTGRTIGNGLPDDNPPARARGRSNGFQFPTSNEALGENHSHGYIPAHRREPSSANQTTIMSGASGEGNRQDGLDNDVPQVVDERIPPMYRRLFAPRRRKERSPSPDSSFQPERYLQKPGDAAGWVGPDKIDMLRVKAEKDPLLKKQLIGLVNYLEAYDPGQWSNPDIIGLLKQEDRECAYFREKLLEIVHFLDLENIQKRKGPSDLAELPPDRPSSSASTSVVGSPQLNPPPGTQEATTSPTPFHDDLPSELSPHTTKETRAQEDEANTAPSTPPADGNSASIDSQTPSGSGQTSPNKQQEDGDDARKHSMSSPASVTSESQSTSPPFPSLEICPVAAEISKYDIAPCTSARYVSIAGPKPPLPPSSGLTSPDSLNQGCLLPPQKRPLAEPSSSDRLNRSVSDVTNEPQATASPMIPDIRCSGSSHNERPTSPSGQTGLPQGFLGGHPLSVPDTSINPPWGTSPGPIPNPALDSGANSMAASPPDQPHNTSASTGSGSRPPDHPLRQPRQPPQTMYRQEVSRCCWCYGAIEEAIYSSLDLSSNAETATDAPSVQTWMRTEIQTPLGPFIERCSHCDGWFHRRCGEAYRAHAMRDGRPITCPECLQPWQ